MIAYCIQSIIGLGISLLIYQLLLRKGKSFVFNRFYLLFSLMLLLFVPMLQIETAFEVPLTNEFNTSTIITGKTILEENIKSVTVETMSNLPILKILPTVLWSIYSIVSLLFLFRFSRNLIHIGRSLRQHESAIDGLKLIFIERKTIPYSFFNYLFVNKQQYNNGRLTPAILQHEKSHSNQFHTLDVLLIEFITCLFWFNPFIWLYKKMMVENHEYLADASVIKKGFTIPDYSKEIVQSGHQFIQQPLVSGFSYIQTKNRLIMLSKTPSNKFLSTTKLAGALLLFCALFTLNSFIPGKEVKPLVVVIDSGHGGKDAGVSNDQLSEKEITLSIAEKLAAYNKRGKIKVLLTRTNDDFMTLKNRVAYINEQQPDLFISLHVNQSPNKTANGVESYYYDGEHSAQSKVYSKILVSEQLKTFSNRGEIKTANFFLLKNTNCPGVLLELGFLSNDTDRQLLSNPQNHNQIAASIYNGLLEISRLK